MMEVEGSDHDHEEVYVLYPSTSTRLSHFLPEAEAGTTILEIPFGTNVTGYSLPYYHSSTSRAACARPAQSGGGYGGTVSGRFEESIAFTNNYANESG